MIRLTLSMIVKNAEATLARCLDSARAVVDAISICDTGSTDGTLDIARLHGASVKVIAWENDFARARNEALEGVDSDWVLSLDADEVLDPGAAQVVPRLLSVKPLVEGYLVPIWNYVASLDERLWDRPAKPNRSKLEAARDYTAYVEHENVRLFRRQPHIRFTGRVHESVGSSILGHGGRLDHANFAIHHFGLAAEADTCARKNRLYRELGRMKIVEEPDNAQAHLELGLVEFDNFHEDREALRCFERACKLNPNLTVAWFFTGQAHLRLKQYGQAVRAFEEAERRGNRTALLAESQGDACYNMADFSGAHILYKRALSRWPRNAAVLSKLGLVEVRLGQTQAGLRRLERAIETSPESPDLYDRLMLAAITIDRLDLAAEAAERKIAATPPTPEGFLRAASVRAQQQNWPRVRELLQDGCRRFPDANHLAAALAELEAHEPRTSVL
jgi:tetratricopeptide (TPR) repeat protein